MTSGVGENPGGFYMLIKLFLSLLEKNSLILLLHFLTYIIQRNRIGMTLYQV